MKFSLFATRSLQKKGQNVPVGYMTTFDKPSFAVSGAVPVSTNLLLFLSTGELLHPNRKMELSRHFIEHIESKRKLTLKTTGNESEIIQIKSNCL